MMNKHKNVLVSQIDQSLKVIRMFDWLLDMYVLDFFVDNHWDKLPASWRECFLHIDPRNLGTIIINGTATGHMYPLSFLALIKTVDALKIPREVSLKSAENNNIVEDNGKCGSHPKLKNLFLKHVKLKKRHEISLMAEVVNRTAVLSKCNTVIDFGSGLGHLVRMLAYKYELYTAGIECQGQLTEEARKLDLELEYTAKKQLSPTAASELRRPSHFNMTLSHSDQLSQLNLPYSISHYGLIGLHPCGDLGPLLTRHFVQNENIKFICVVGCCYMKLNEGYPLSRHLKRLDSGLSYASREIACHAIESYCDRLMARKYEDLKVHAYRAALETILMEISPKLKHAPVRSIKHTNSMSFERYCTLALEKLSVPQPTTEQYSRGEQLLTQWRRVVTVYTLRLALAPLVETVILLDRLLFVLEQGISCEIRPVFDPRLSPRNHIIIGRK